MFAEKPSPASTAGEIATRLSSHAAGEEKSCFRPRWLERLFSQDHLGQRQFSRPAHDSPLNTKLNWSVDRFILWCPRDGTSHQWAGRVDIRWFRAGAVANVKSSSRKTVMARAATKKKARTSIDLLEAAKKVLRQNGYAKLSTRQVAAAANVPLSQIHYHFGSKQGLVLALFEYFNAQLLDRQDAMFDDPKLTLSEKWDRACDYLDEDIASGYVRTLQELIAASWADARVAKVVRNATMGWVALITDAARGAERQFGGLARFTPEELGALVANAFVGAESLYLLGFEAKRVPVRQALRRVGDLIRLAERDLK